MREVVQDNEEEMWFQFGKDRVRFGMEEFLIISGLKFFGNEGRRKYCGMFNRLKNTYFMDYVNISIEVVGQVFTSNQAQNDSDAVKLGIILLLTSYLFTSSHSAKNIDLSLMTLVDSEEMNDYAWGKELFKSTISAFRRGMHKKQIIRESKGRPSMSYKLSGFLIAFQVWIYETLPILQNLVWTKVNNRYPRILNWSSEVGVKRKIDLETDIFLRPDLSAVTIKVTMEERRQPYLFGIYEDVPPVFVADSDEDVPLSDILRRGLFRGSRKNDVASTSNAVPSLVTDNVTTVTMGSKKRDVASTSSVVPSVVIDNITTETMGSKKEDLPSTSDAVPSVVTDSVSKDGQLSGSNTPVHESSPSLDPSPSTDALTANGVPFVVCDSPIVGVQSPVRLNTVYHDGCSDHINSKVIKCSCN